jgi:hypothetical protein
LLSGNDKQTCGEATLPRAGDEERDKTMTPNSTFTTPLPVALPPVPADVFAFAAAQGAAVEDVQCVLTMTRRLFPTSPLSLRVREDSTSEDSYIVVEVDAREGSDDIHIALAPTEWTDELLRQCPSSQMWLFRLALA